MDLESMIKEELIEVVKLLKRQRDRAIKENYMPKAAEWSIQCSEHEVEEWVKLLRGES